MPKLIDVDSISLHVCTWSEAKMLSSKPHSHSASYSSNSLQFSLFALILYVIITIRIGYRRCGYWYPLTNQRIRIWLMHMDYGIGYVAARRHEEKSVWFGLCTNSRSCWTNTTAITIMFSICNLLLFRFLAHTHNGKPLVVWLWQRAMKGRRRSNHFHLMCFTVSWLGPGSDAFHTWNSLWMNNKMRRDVQCNIIRVATYSLYIVNVSNNVLILFLGVIILYAFSFPRIIF